MAPLKQTRAALAALAVLGATRGALAGMPAPVLTDAGRLRLQSLGFFIAVFFALAALFQRLWNWLRGDFASLPRLSYRRAMGMVFLWGMALELVLTMISGARELLTPGAWEKVGVTYQVKPSRPGATPVDLSPEARQARISRLAAALSAQPALPKSARASGLPEDLWVAPGGAHYVYLGDLSGAMGVIACEPPGQGDERLVILPDFTVISLPKDELSRRLSEGESRLIKAASP